LFRVDPSFEDPSIFDYWCARVMKFQYLYFAFIIFFFVLVIFFINMLLYLIVDQNFTKLNQYIKLRVNTQVSFTTQS
jgi:hypothetical protein